MIKCAFHLENICVKSGKAHILHNISIDIKYGGRVSVIGPNGAGKTTLLRVLAGLVKPVSGNFFVDGRSAAGLSAIDWARLVAYVPQMLEKSLPCKVEDFVLLARYSHGRHSFGSADAEDRRAVERAVELTGISGLTERDISTLSGGERQKVLLAAALAQEAPILLLDEPAAFLDYAHRLELKELLDSIRKERMQKGVSLTVVDVVHDLNGGALESDSIIALVAGKVAFCGDVASLINGSRLEEIYGVRFERLSSPIAANTVLVPTKRIFKAEESGL